MIVSGEVVVSLAVTNDYYVYPHNSSEFPLGPGEVDPLVIIIIIIIIIKVDLLGNITALFDAGAACAAGNACNGTFANLEETP